MKRLRAAPNKKTRKEAKEETSRKGIGKKNSTKRWVAPRGLAVLSERRLKELPRKELRETQSTSFRGTVRKGLGETPKCTQRGAVTATLPKGRRYTLRETQRGALNKTLRRTLTDTLTEAPTEALRQLLWRGAFESSDFRRNKIFDQKILYQ